MRSFVEGQLVETNLVKGLVARHLELTAAHVLRGFSTTGLRPLSRFIKVFPHEHKRVLE